VQRAPASAIRKSFDVVIVGGGPAGSVTALAVAGRGRSVLQVERCPEFGWVQRCAEGVLRSQLHLYVEPQPEFIRAEIHAARFYAPNGTFADIQRPNSGYILNRPAFDRELAGRAAAAGVEQWTSSYPQKIGVTKSGVELEILRDGVLESVGCEIIVGADGVDSRVAQWTGLASTLAPGQIGCCYQETIRHDSINPERIGFFVGKDVAPGGYAWVFPRGGNEANAGVVIGGNFNRSRMAKAYFESWIGKYYSKAIRSTPMCGGIPGFSKGQPIAGERVLLVGDAARQVNPLAASGILEALRAGRIAGEVIAEACRHGDFSARYLQRYQKEWQNSLGNKHQKYWRIKQAIDRLDDDTYNQATAALCKLDPAQTSVTDVFRALLFRKPGLILLLRHLF